MFYRRYLSASRPRTGGPFRRGFLKHVILHYLAERPHHGYEIIRALEERFHGLYTPSAGSVYPTLQMLEEMGLVTSVEQEGKKIYTITEEGRRFVAEHEHQQRDIAENLEMPKYLDGLGKTATEFDKLAELLGREARRMDAERLEQVRRVIIRAHADIESISKAQGVE